MQRLRARGNLHNLRSIRCHPVVFKSSRIAGSNVPSGGKNWQRLQSPARSHTTITKASPQGNHRPRQSRCRERLTTGMIQCETGMLDTERCLLRPCAPWRLPPGRRFSPKVPRPTRRSRVRRQPRPSSTPSSSSAKIGPSIMFSPPTWPSTKARVFATSSQKVSLGAMARPDRITPQPFNAMRSLLEPRSSQVFTRSLPDKPKH